MKACNTCKNVLSFDMFHKDRSKVDGFKLTCKDCRKIETKNRYIKHKDSITVKIKEYVQLNKEAVKERHREWSKSNYDPIKRREYFLKYKNKINARNVHRYNTDILYRLKRCLSRRLYMALKSNKNHSIVEYLGCDIAYFKDYMQSLFLDGMSWDNYGQWHIDHIIPISSAKIEEDLYKLSHYTNMQPMWAIDNIKKGKKIGEK